MKGYESRSKSDVEATKRLPKAMARLCKAMEGDCEALKGNDKALKKLRAHRECVLELETKDLALGRADHLRHYISRQGVISYQD